METLAYSIGYMIGTGIGIGLVWFGFSLVFAGIVLCVSGIVATGSAIRRKLFRAPEDHPSRVPIPRPWWDEGSAPSLHPGHAIGVDRS